MAGILGEGKHTSVVDLPTPGPILDKHGKLPDPGINLDISADHPCVLQCKGVVDVHVASKLQLRVPHLHDGHFGSRYADDVLETLCNSVSEPSCIVVWDD